VQEIEGIGEEQSEEEEKNIAEMMSALGGRRLKETRD
jgi:hypothetical protein